MLLVVPSVIMGKYEYDDNGTAVKICELTEEEQKALDQHNKNIENAKRERFVADDEWDDEGKVIPIPNCTLTEEEHKVLDKFSTELEEAYNDRARIMSSKEIKEEMNSWFAE